MPSHHTYEYARLPERTKRQLIKSMAEPGLHLSEDGDGNTVFYISRSVLAVSLSLFLVMFVSAQFGVPGKDDLWSGTDYMLGYGLFIASIVALAMAIRNRVQLNKLFGFVPKQYIFSSTLVDARKPELQVVDLAQLKRIEVTEHRYQGLIYSHTIFSFSFHDAPSRKWRVSNKKRAAQFCDRLDAMQGQARAAFERNDIASLLKLDPFFEIRRNNWALPGDPPARDPGWKRWLPMPVVVGLAAALVLSPLIWTARNVGADMAMHTEAKRLQTEAAYHAYTLVGWFHVDEMRAAMPRVALAEVKKMKSVTALRGLLQRYPNVGLQAEVNQEIHLLYQVALAKFASQAATADPALLPSMTRLLQVLEQRGDPAVGIRFRRPSTDALVELDARIKRNEARMAGKEIIPVSEHFASDSAAAREARIVNGLRAGFRMIFPNDVLSLQVVPEADTRLPVLTIDYQIEPSGALYTLEGGQRAFVGLVARFQSGLKVGEEGDPWRFEMEVEPPDHFEVGYTGAPNQVQKGPADSQVYSVMAERAFDALSQKMRAAFFHPDSAAFKGMKVVETGK